MKIDDQVFKQFDAREAMKQREQRARAEAHCRYIQSCEERKEYFKTVAFTMTMIGLVLLNGFILLAVK